MRTFYARYYSRLWNRYGLKDAYNIEENWFATDYIGIDQGPILLMIENERTEALWTSFMAHPDVQRGLDRAGFAPTPVADEDGADAADVALAPPMPNPASGRVRLAYELASAGPVRLSVLDVLGREVAVLVDRRQLDGAHAAEWNAEGVAAGVYIVRLAAEAAVRARTVVVTR